MAEKPDSEIPALAPTVGAGNSKDALPPEGPRPGALLGKRYKVDGLLGVGGMGSVYRAVDEVLGKEVALKFLDEKLAQGQASFERLRDEVLLAQEVSHKNVCRTYDLEVDDRWVVKMEYVDGETLAERIARVGTLDVPKTLAIARQIADGLGAAHERGVVHRDLKPHNVLLEAATGRVVRGTRSGAADCGAGRLVFVRSAGRDSPSERLLVRDADGTERDLVLFAPGEDVPYFRCDRDGTRVVYTVADYTQIHARSDIRLIGLDGSGARSLTDDGQENAGATFHPDGRSIVFSSKRGGKWNLWELPLSGGPPAQLSFG
jgi:hypothetical protein